MASVKQLVRSGDGYMNFIDYERTYRDNNKEFLRGDMWEFSFINRPKVVYYPGDNILNGRLNSVSVSINSSLTSFSKGMRGGYVLHQSTGQTTDGTLSLAFTDREDQAIIVFGDDWKQKISDRDTKYSFRKDDVVADCKMVYTNSSRNKVRTLQFFNCSLEDFSHDENGVAESGSDRADCQMTLKFEHYDRSMDNL